MNGRFLKIRKEGQTIAETILKVGSLDNPDESTFTPLPNPSEMRLLLQDIDNSSTGRSASGLMLRDRIAGGEDAKRKIECVWNAIDSEKVSTILQTVGPEFVKVVYPDAYLNTDRVGVFYVGDRNAEMYAYKFVNGEKHLYKTLKFNFIEQ